LRVEKRNQTHEKRRKKRPKKKERRRKISGGVRARQRDEHAGELAINTRSVCRQFISSLNRIAQSVAHIFSSQITKKTQKLQNEIHCFGTSIDDRGEEQYLRIISDKFLE
jgi:hypothetical protein